MPKIRIPKTNQLYHYNTIPLYPGVKRINKIVALENLILLKSLLDANNIKFQLAAGTLLGAIRNHDFIDHDEDIDLALLDTERIKFLSILPKLRENGFELCRYDRRDLYSIMRNGEYIDLYFFRPYDEDKMICSGWVVKSKFLLNSIEYLFLGEKYLIPKDFDDYLKIEYGDNWHIPIQYNNYDHPKWKILLFNVKEHIKEYLPIMLYNCLASKSEQKLIEKSLSHIRRLD